MSDYEGQIRALRKECAKSRIERRELREQLTLRDARIAALQAQVGELIMALNK